MRIVFALGCFFLLLGARPVWAEPLLQLYLEGGTYNSASETWTLTPEGSSNGEPFRIWAIGNTSQQSIYNVRIAASYTAEAGDVSLSLTPSQAGGLGVGAYQGFTDPTVSQSVEYEKTVSDGSTPKLGDGRNLPSHGVYGDGVVWQEFLLGDFTQKETKIADFFQDFPTPGNKLGQINVYEVVVTGSMVHPLQIHFDLYDTVYSGNKVRGVFAPFSHSAGVTADATIAPEPSTMMLALLGMVGFGGFHRYRIFRTRELVGA